MDGDDDGRARASGAAEGRAVEDVEPTGRRAAMPTGYQARSRATVDARPAPPKVSGNDLEPRPARERAGEAVHDAGRARRNVCASGDMSKSDPHRAVLVAQKHRLAGGAPGEAGRVPEAGRAQRARARRAPARSPPRSPPGRPDRRARRRRPTPRPSTDGTRRRPARRTPSPRRSASRSPRSARDRRPLRRRGRGRASSSSETNPSRRTRGSSSAGCSPQPSPPATASKSRRRGAGARGRAPGGSCAARASPP